MTITGSETAKWPPPFMVNLRLGIRLAFASGLPRFNEKRQSYRGKSVGLNTDKPLLSNLIS